MTNKARILDHTTATFSTERVVGWEEDLMVPKTITVEGIEFTFHAAGYYNTDLQISLYAEGDEEYTEFWYAQTDPI